MIKTLNSDVYTRTCTQLTFDLILGLWGHFQTWHPPLSFLKHIKIHFEHGCQNVLKNANRFFFQALDGQLRGPYKPHSRSKWTRRVQLLPEWGPFENYIHLWFSKEGGGWVRTPFSTLWIRLCICEKYQIKEAEQNIELFLIEITDESRCTDLRRH